MLYGIQIVNAKIRIYIMKEGLYMKHISKKLSSVIITILFVIAAMFFVYGIYMIYYSINHIHTYMNISTISSTSAFQYVVTSSAVYFGFAVVISTGAFILIVLKKIYLNIIQETKIHSDNKNDIAIDEHPENNPYYTGPESCEIDEIKNISIKDIFNNK